MPDGWSTVSQLISAGSSDALGGSHDRPTLAAGGRTPKLDECARRGNTITILERRAPWNPELIGPDWTSLEVARLRFDQPSGRWSLYCRDSNERWWPYENIETSASIHPPLAEIDADPTGIFWG